jgi:hypothetical protein
MKPELHVNSQLLPEEMTDAQVPRLPFAGADTAHAFAAHVCVAVKFPFVHDVTEPTSV